jgi:septal ring factor EnvC (AmiA/AmiB activator)
VAEEVEKINPALVVHDPDGKPYTVRYDAVNAMLLNEFLKQRRKVEAQQIKIEEQQKEINDLAAQLKQQATQIQKVSAEVELNKAAPHTVANR